MVPRWEEERPGPSGWIGLLILGGVLLAAMPLAAANPAWFVPVVVGDAQISWFGVAGLILVGVLAIWHPLEWYRAREGVGAAILAGFAAFAVVYVCQVAMSAMLHHLSLSPERLVVMAMATVLMFPFWIGFELLVRRGGLAISTLWASLGRVLILVMMGVGVSHGRIAVRADAGAADYRDRFRDDRNILGVGLQRVAQSHADSGG